MMRVANFSSCFSFPFFLLVSIGTFLLDWFALGRIGFVGYGHVMLGISVASVHSQT